MGQSGSQDRNALEVLFTQFPNKLEHIPRGEGNENQFWKLYEADFMNEDHRNENSAASFVSNLATVNGDSSAEPSKGKAEKRKCSVFELKTNSEYFLKYTPEQRNIALQCAKNAIRRVKQFRHPNIIKYLDSYDKNTTNPNNTNLDHVPQVLLATELVTPLRIILPSLERSEILYGLSQIVSAIEWLHKQCNMVYNNLHIDSIYVSQDKQMRWLLGDFQFATDYNNELTETFISETQRYRYADAITPEEGMLKFKKFKIHSRDAYALGKLIEAISTINSASSIPVPHCLVDSDPAKRSIVSSASFMRGDTFCEVMNVFDDLRVKETAEKEKFFRNLDRELSSISSSLVRKRLLHRMLSFPFVTEPSASHFLPHLFTVKGSGTTLQGVLEKADFNKYVVPFIERCLESKNRALRSRMLSVLENFVPNLDANYVIDKLFPEIVVGLKDTSDDLVMYSMNAAVMTSTFVSSFSDKLSESINNVIKILHHYATFEQNSDVLRSHALVCLVDLWALPKVTKSVIYSALYHILYNPTSYEMKIHALNVILLHVKSFTPKELSSVIIKLVTDFVLHERPEVRVKALSVLEHSTEVLKETSQEIFAADNYGMLSRNQKPSPILILQPNFPVESTYPLERKAFFSGNGPRIGELAEIKLLEEDTNRSVPTQSIIQHQELNKPVTKGQEKQEEDEVDDVPVQSIDLSEAPKLVVSKRVNITISDTKSDEDEQEDWNQDAWDKEEDTESKVATHTQESVNSTSSTEAPAVESLPSKKFILSSTKISKPEPASEPTTTSPATKIAPPQKSLLSQIEDDEPLATVDNEPDYFSEMGMNASQPISSLVPTSINTSSVTVPSKKTKKSKSKVIEDVKSVENSPSGPSAMAQHMESVEELNDEVLSGWGESMNSVASSADSGTATNTENGEKKKKKKKKKDLFTPFDTSVIDSFISTLPPDSNPLSSSSITSSNNSQNGGETVDEGSDVAKTVILSSFGEEKKKRKVGKKKAP